MNTVQKLRKPLKYKDFGKFYTLEMQDAMDGKIDVIYTKSVSRLARNAIDCQRALEQLHSAGVHVVFEKEGIESNAENVDLILKILESIAQQQSNSQSQAILWTVDHNAALGRPAYKCCFGYVKESVDSHFLYGRFICGECGEPMTRKTHRGQKRVWICKDRKMGSKGNGCKNLIIPEDELLEALAEAVGVKWGGAENVKESDFDSLKMVKIFEDGRIEVELREEKKTA